MTVAASGAGPTMGGSPLPTVKLAYRDLLRDRLSQITALLGIVLAIVLAVPFRRIAAQGVVPVGTNGFVDPSLLPGHEKHAILSAPDVVGMEELAVGFVPRCKPGGGRAVAVFAGSDARNDKSPPRDIIAGSITRLSSPDAVAVHATYFKELGILQRGDRAEVNNMQPTAQVVTNGICTLPHALATIGLARGLLDATPEACDARRAAGAVAGHGSHRLRKIRHAQALGLAVRERSWRSADRRRGSGRDGWPRHCRINALLKHRGAHRAASAWRLPRFQSPADPNAGRTEHGHGVRDGHAAQPAGGLLLARRQALGRQALDCHDDQYRAFVARVDGRCVRVRPDQHDQDVAHDDVRRPGGRVSR